MDENRQIGCAVILYNNRIIGWKMNSYIGVGNVRNVLSDKYYQSHKPEDCKIEVKLFEGSESGGWGIEVDKAAQEWMQQWEIDPEYQERIDKGSVFPPY
jgi:hypothetical protein